ncbi:hypothetical protein E3P92_01764 [Wallemia ichthyophaga]|uniref:3-ketoacyl-CoA thiolase B, peroxisomal n=1 Tax=Wallemia ichthyophaga TaxID=245174 RepID=A0A4T0JDZ8_WALIC|nr:hypothetical protein E3P95_02023 [Wallemia ichthyophaga]TIB00564.1 hypothetical protein E3P94_02147 [Wallemia ichthyophaga]TIB14327.1 hypothetical protein E3P90_01310 [Wallemia ichthyophaga]TIB15178.1 hypothetical protein E3P92_01764 [Wallemia ichthyophaga]TIB16208.1 hypothetical protein E3P93_01061 [Wallemia ichthyophaga]
MAKQNIISKNANDVVIVSAVRTPITRARKGGLAGTLPEKLLAHAFKESIQRGKLDPKLIEDIAVGNVLPPGGGASLARMAQLYAGIPHSAAINTVNRQCSSGLQAVSQIALEIASGQIDVGIGAGVESMTAHYGAGAMPPNLDQDVLSNQESADCLIPMGITSENVAKDFGISRAAQDEFAAQSQQKAAAAQKAGKFTNEIAPIMVKSEDGTHKLIDKDDGIRDGVTKETLAKLKPAFDQNGCTHAGNASQVSDGAAAVVLTRRSNAEKLKLPILGKFVASADVGCPPRIMGIGPAVAIPKVLQKAGLSSSDVDIYEINEAFASQALYCVQKLGLDPVKVNPNGGAIALGHPLGCTGARQIATILSEAKRIGAKVLCTSMCIGTGMGKASIIINEQ